MKKNIERIIDIPDGMSAEVSGNQVLIKGKGKEIRRDFAIPGIKIAKAGQQIKITAEKATKKESKLAGSAEAHIRNAFNGINQDFEYRLEICNVHFPMTLKVEGNKLNIKNFLGETIDRSADIVPGAKVEVKGTIIKVASHDREAAGQTAANIEKATRIRNRDRRIFQDGIFITERPGDKK
jgi:large subunit ribosomal protein L6